MLLKTICNTLTASVSSAGCGTLIYNRRLYKIRWNIKIREHLGLIAIIAITITVGMVLTALNLLPEQQAMKYNPLLETPIKTDFRVIETPSPGNNTYIYALNEVAEDALHIAQNDNRVKQIINEQKDKALTIAAVQPTVILDERNGTGKSG